MTTELDSLAGAVAAADATATALAPPPVGEDGQPIVEPPPAPGPDEQALDMVNMFAGLVVGYAPAAADVWTEDNRRAAASVIAPVMVKYGFSMMALPPELAAAIVVGPLLYRTSTIVAEKIRADRADKKPVKALTESTKPTIVPPPAGPDGAPSAGVHEQVKLYP